MASNTVDFFAELINECKCKDKKGERSSRLIYNADIEHAKVAVRAILDVAVEDGKDVCIVTESLREDFYTDSDLVSKVRQVLASRHMVEIIVLNPNADLSNNTFADVVKSDQNGNIWFGDKGHSAPHFIVTGDKVFRLETDHNQTKATISFNNESMGSCLLAEFNRLKLIFEHNKWQGKH